MENIENAAGSSTKNEKNSITETELLKKEIITPEDVLRLDKITTGKFCKNLYLIRI